MRNAFESTVLDLPRHLTLYPPRVDPQSTAPR
jgi:hypothetical protein